MSLEPPLCRTSVVHQHGHSYDCKVSPHTSLLCVRHAQNTIHISASLPKAWKPGLSWKTGQLRCVCPHLSGDHQTCLVPLSLCFDSSWPNIWCVFRCIFIMRCCELSGSWTYMFSLGFFAGLIGWELVKDGSLRPLLTCDAVQTAQALLECLVYYDLKQRFLSCSERIA